MTLGFDLKRAREIIILAAPIVIAMVTQMGINVLDTVFVGKLDPTIATPGQAALGFGLPLLWAFGGSIAAIGIGTQVMTARRFGSGDELAAGSIMTNAVVVALSSSLVMSALAVLLVDDLFRFFTTDQSIIDLGIPYAQIRIIGIISMVTTTAIKGFFDGVGRTRIHMYAALMMNVTNIILNYVFIFGFGPIPSYAVTGAGIASTISTFVGLAMIIGFTFSPITRPYSLYNPKNINGRTMWELIKLSVPSGLAQLFIMSGVLMFLTIISSLDDQAISTTLGALSHYSDSSLTAMVGVHEAMRLSPELARPAMLHDWGSVILHSRPPMFAAGAKVIIDLLSLGFVTTIAFGTATATLVSQSMGRGKFRLAANYGWDSVKLGMYFYGGLGLLVMLFPSPFLDLLTDDPAVIAVATPGLQIMAGLEIFVAMALILTQALFGAGDTKFVMVTEFLLHGLCLAPMTYLFARVLDLGFLGVWMSATLYVVLLGVSMAVRFWLGKWADLRV